MRETRYNKVAERLRGDILAGRYAPGVRLPPERELVGHYKVSRITIRQALAVLEDEQLVIRRQGSGTYVSRNPRRRIPLMIDYTGSIRDHAPTLTRELLTSCRRPAPDWVAASLHLGQAAEVFHAERVDRLGEIAVAWDEVYLRPSFAGNLTLDDLDRVDFLEAWCEAEHFKPAVCRQRVEAVRAGRCDHERLGLCPGAPLLRAIDIYDAARNKPVGMFVSHYHPKFITITSRFDYTGMQR